MIKQLFFVLMAFAAPGYIQAQSAGIGTTTPNSSAVLDVTSSSKGILIPRLTTAQRDAIVNPANGLLIYNSTVKQYNFYNGTRWQQVNGIPKGAMVLNKNYDDPEMKNEGFTYSGYITQDVNSQTIGDTTIPAFNWYKGNTYFFDNAGAPLCNASVRSVFIDSLLYCFAYDSVFIYSRSNNRWVGKPVNFAPALNFLASATHVYRVGSQVVFWDTNLRKGFRYRYLLNTWDTISTVNAPGYREYFKAVATGAELIFWGGRRVDPTFTFYEYPTEGYRYNPTTNIWTVIPAPPGFQGRVDASMAYSNNGFLIWGGRQIVSVTRTFSGFCNGTVTLDSSVNFTDGRFYNMLSNSWVTVPASGAPAARHNAAVVFDGTNIVIAGGRMGRLPQLTCKSCGFSNYCVVLSDRDSIYKSGAKYDPVNNAWISIPDAPRPFADADPLWDNDQYMTMFIGDDTSLSFEPSANDWFINLHPTLSAGYVSSYSSAFAVNNSEFIIYNPAYFGAPATLACWASHAAVYNFRTTPVTIRAIKSSQVQTGQKFYLYQKE